MSPNEPETLLVVGNTSVGQQVPDSVFTYGWQICFRNQTTNILGNLSVDKTITTNNLVVNDSTRFN